MCIISYFNILNCTLSLKILSIIATLNIYILASCTDSLCSVVVLSPKVAVTVFSLTVKLTSFNSRRLKVVHPQSTEEKCSSSKGVQLVPVAPALPPLHSLHRTISAYGHVVRSFRVLHKKLNVSTNKTNNHRNQPSPSLLYAKKFRRNPVVIICNSPLSPSPSTSALLRSFGAIQWCT